MAVKVNAVLTSSHNYIKITSKLQNNYHSDPLEIRLNRNPTIRGLNKKPPRLVEVVETGGRVSELVAPPICGSINWEGYLGCRGFQCQEKSPHIFRL